MKSLYFWVAGILLLAFVAPAAATSPPFYVEDFESYAVGDTAVTNFTELSTGAWTIVSPSISGKGYQNAISAVSPGPGVAAGENSSSAINIPALTLPSFEVATLFRIDAFTLTGADTSNTGTIGLFARGTDSTPASTNSDRYQASYFLDDDGSGHATGKLWLREVNLFFGDSLNEVSTSALAVTPGDIYKFTLGGTVSGSSLILTATLTDTTTSTSISVSDTDSANLLTGANFGYFNHVRANAGGSSVLNADFDNFSLAAPEPATAVLLLAGAAWLVMTRLRIASKRPQRAPT